MSATLTDIAATFLFLTSLMLYRSCLLCPSACVIVVAQQELPIANVCLEWLHTCLYILSHLLTCLCCAQKLKHSKPSEMSHSTERALSWFLWRLTQLLGQLPEQCPLVCSYSKGSILHSNNQLSCRSNSICCPVIHRNCSCCHPPMVQLFAVKGGQVSSNRNLKSREQHRRFFANCSCSCFKAHCYSSSVHLSCSGNSIYLHSGIFALHTLEQLAHGLVASCLSCLRCVLVAVA